MNDIQLAKALGYLSLGLGAVELIAPRRLSRLLGLRRAKWVVRAFGAREIAAGFAVLTYPDNPMPLWARVGGDAADLAVLGTSLLRGRRKRGNAGAAALVILGVTALDAACALALHGRQTRAMHVAQRARIAAPSPAA